MCRKGQASALGAVFLTILLAMIVVVLVHYSRSQSELQTLASQVQAQRASEGFLSLSINDTYTLVLTGNSSGAIRLSLLSGTMESNGTLDALDGGGLVLKPASTASGYLLQANFSTQIPSSTVSFSQALHVRPSAPLSLQVYSKAGSGNYVLASSYVLPAGVASAIVLTSPNAILSAYSPSSFSLLLDYIQANTTLYNHHGLLPRSYEQGARPSSTQRRLGGHE